MESFNERIEIIGQNVRIMRKAQLLTIEALSQKADIAVTVISAIENNRATGVTLSTLINLANALGSDLESLITGINTAEYDVPVNELDEEECINLIARSEILKTFYPPMARDHEISSMLELIVVLPLLNPLDLYDNLLRISCSTDGYEDYIAEQISQSWRRVPDSPMRQYAEKELASIRKIRQDGDPDFSESFLHVQFRNSTSDFEMIQDYIMKRYSYIKDIKYLCENNPWLNR